MCQRVMAALGRAYYFSMGFRVVVKGKQVSSSEAPILAVAPHSTFFDGIVCIVAGLPSTVSRVENLATPIFGSKMLLIGVVIDRKVGAYVFEETNLIKISSSMCLCVCELEKRVIFLNFFLKNYMFFHKANQWFKIICFSVSFFFFFTYISSQQINKCSGKKKYVNPLR